MTPGGPSPRVPPASCSWFLPSSAPRARPVSPRQLRNRRRWVMKSEVDATSRSAPRGLAAPTPVSSDEGMLPATAFCRAVSPAKKPLAPSVHLPPSLSTSHPHPPGTTGLFLVSIALPSPGCHIVGITQYADWQM